MIKRAAEILPLKALICPSSSPPIGFENQNPWAFYVWKLFRNYSVSSSHKFFVFIIFSFLFYLCLFLICFFVCPSSDKTILNRNPDKKCQSFENIFQWRKREAGFDNYLVDNIGKFCYNIIAQIKKKQGGFK